MKPKKLVKARAFFQHNVCEFVESIRAFAKPCDYAKNYILETAIGQVEITVFENWIACQLADLCAAHTFTHGQTGLYCGKWNFLYTDEADVLNNGLVIGNFVLAVERLLAYAPTPEDVAKTERLRVMFPRAATIIQFYGQFYGQISGSNNANIG